MRTYLYCSAALQATMMSAFRRCKHQGHSEVIDINCRRRQTRTATQDLVLNLTSTSMILVCRVAVSINTGSSFRRVASMRRCASSAQGDHKHFRVFTRLEQAKVVIMTQHCHITSKLRLHPTHQRCHGGHWHTLRLAHWYLSCRGGCGRVWWCGPPAPSLFDSRT